MDKQEYHIEAQQIDHWWFVGRRCLLKSLIERFAIEKINKKFDLVLDVGCGVGSNCGALRSNAIKLVGVDMDPVAIDYCKNQTYDLVVESPLDKLTPDDIGARPDFLVAMDILEHLPDDAGGMVSIYEILNNGGLAFITVPACPWLWGMQDVIGHHYRRYTKKSLEKLLRGSGFKVVRLTYFNTWLFLPIVLMRLAMKVWRPKNVISESQVNAPWINKPLAWFFSEETKGVAKGRNYPFGISLLAVVRKV